MSKSESQKHVKSLQATYLQSLVVVPPCGMRPTRARLITNWQIVIQQEGHNAELEILLSEFKIY